MFDKWEITVWESKTLLATGRLIKGLSKDDSSSQIDPETWVNHFSNLHPSINEFTKHALTAY